MNKMALNKNQWAAVNHKEGPCCVIAGAGSGKTSVLVQRIIALIRGGVDPAAILAVTFSKKATAEMAVRLEKTLGKSKVSVCTFHSLGYRILKSESGGYVDGKTPIKEYQKIAFIKETMKGTLLEDLEAAPKHISTWIGLQKNNLVHWSQRPQNPNGDEDEVGALFDMYAAYEEYKRSSLFYDFDDMVDVPVYRLRENEGLRRRLSNRFRYILADEYQDTGSAQSELLRLIAPEHNSVFVVGDDFQSIYSFRGSDVRNILDFDKNFLGAKMIYLDVNYRSSPEIVNASNVLIANNKSQFNKTVIANSKSTGKKPTFVMYSDEKAEADSVANKIKTLVDGGASYGDFAVLYRINSLSRVFESAMLENDIPFHVEGGVCFFEQQYVSDVIDYLRLALDINDSDAMLRILNRPNRYFGKVFRDAVESYMAAKKVPAWKAISEMPLSHEWRYAKNVSGFFRHLGWLSARNYQQPADLLYYIYDDIGYKDFIKTDAGDELYEERKESIDELLFLGKQFQTVQELVQYADVQLAAYEKYSNNPDSVTLSTVHKAKGLEYPVVFVVTCVDGMFPHKNSPSVEEERRIMYVAMTRAIHTLEISAVEFRRDEPASLSPFVSEISGCVQALNLAKSTIPGRA